MNSGSTFGADPHSTTVTETVSYSNVNTVAPALSGTAKIGNALTTTDGTWTGSPAPTFTYKWQRRQRHDWLGEHQRRHHRKRIAGTFTLSELWPAGTIDGAVGQDLLAKISASSTANSEVNLQGFTE